MYAQDANRQLSLLVAFPVDEVRLLPAHAGFMVHMSVLGRGPWGMFTPRSPGCPLGDIGRPRLRSSPVGMRCWRLPSRALASSPTSQSSRHIP